MNNQYEPLVTRHEVADMLRLSYHTIRSWDSRGKPDLKPIKVGGLVRYHLRDIDAYLVERMNKKYRKRRRPAA